MIFPSFGSKGKLGIDIGTAAIKIVELEKQHERFSLVNYGLFELKGADVPTAPAARLTNLSNQSIEVVASLPVQQAGLPVRPSSQPVWPARLVGQGILKLPDNEIVWGIKEVIKKSDMKATNVVASIPSFSTFATVLEMPYLSEEDLAKAMPYEARKYIPIPLDQVVLDWSIIDVASASQAAHPATVQVFMAAVPKEETIRYQSIMTKAGLNLKALELENSALIRSLLGNDLNPTAIINIGGRSTSIVIVSRGYERLSHNYEIGGFEITKSIARSLNVSMEKAEELKRRIGLKEENENVIIKAMVSLIDMMAFETKKTISNFEESKHVKIERLLLVGGLANMPNFAPYFSKKLNRPVYLGNSLARVIYPEALKPIVQELANIFCVSLGLAMRQ